MKHAALKTTFAAVAMTAALLPMASSADAAARSTTHCSGWHQAGTSKHYVRECAKVMKNSTGTHVQVTASIKRTGGHNLKVSGFVALSWGQAGDGTGFGNVSLAMGHSKAITHKFNVESAGPYTATASITVGDDTATAQTTFRK